MTFRRGYHCELARALPGDDKVVRSLSFRSLFATTARVKSSKTCWKSLMPAVVIETGSLQHQPAPLHELDCSAKGDMQVAPEAKVPTSCSRYSTRLVHAPQALAKTCSLREEQSHRRTEPSVPPVDMG